MARLMGRDAYVAMVTQMRAVLGNERADAMIARCESQMAASAAGTTMSGGMMGGMTEMMGSHR